MAEKILKFPQGFLWGAATSAYQIEGGIENADWSKVFPAGTACDHWDRWREDFDLLSKLNLNAYRMSVEWSRVEPEEGKFNKAALLQYKEMLQYLKSRGIKTFITLHHFTTPQWLTEKGGWENKKVLRYFARFAKIVFKELGELADFWQTINEPIIYATLSYLEGRWPPRKKSLWACLKVIRNQILAHRTVYNLFHGFKESVKVGIAKNNTFFEPKNPASSLGKFSASLVSYFLNRFFLNRLKNHLDFIGLNYYFRNKISLLSKEPAESVLESSKLNYSDIGWEIYPKGIYHTLQELKIYNLPIYITENGIADKDDKLRAKFIKDHLYLIWTAIQEGVDVRGYFYWSLIDNFEWDKGFGPRFGLIEVDYQNDFARKLRPSAYFYSRIAKTGDLKL